jgi:hypothetical protein
LEENFQLQFDSDDVRDTGSERETEIVPTDNSCMDDYASQAITLSDDEGTQPLNDDKVVNNPKPTINLLKW